MKKVRPLEMLDRVKDVLTFDSPPTRLLHLLESQLATHFQLSQLEAAEQSSSLEPRVAAHIEKAISKSEEMGVAFSLLLVGSEGSRMVCGSAYIFPTDSPLDRSLKTNRSKTSQLMQAMMDLTPEQFERFGSCVLKLLGAQTFHVTQQSGDQGIDFYGVLRLGQLLQAPEKFFHLSHKLELRFAGQAKHYPRTVVGTAVVRELAGAVSLARYKAFSSEVDMFEDLGLLPFNPLVLLLFTTGRLSKGARELSEKAGILSYSGDQLAAFLADCGVGMIEEAGATVFSKDEFLRWLQ